MLPGFDAFGILLQLASHPLVIGHSYTLSQPQSYFGKATKTKSHIKDTSTFFQPVIAPSFSNTIVVNYH